MLSYRVRAGLVDGVQEAVHEYSRRLAQGEDAIRENHALRQVLGILAARAGGELRITAAELAEAADAPRTVQVFHDDDPNVTIIRVGDGPGGGRSAPIAIPPGIESAFDHRAPEAYVPWGGQGAGLL
jgi:hypothetical protein